MLVGRCYDLSETPPFGPWTEARCQFPPSSEGPPGSIPPRPAALQTAAQSPGQFFAEVRAFFVAAAAEQPLVLLLDDMQWADPASLDLLRFLARSLAALPLLLVVNYRPDDLDDHHPFSQLIPLLVRESRAERLDLAPLSAVALHTLIRERYRLGVADEDRLVTYLIRRTEGNALFAHEMLRALAERGMVTTGGETLGDLEGVAVPSLLRQIVAGRVARLGTEAERLLGVAAVIGQQVSLDVWALVGEVDEGVVEAVAEQGLGVRLFVETRGAVAVAFAHALIREALYEVIPTRQRRRLHRTIAETLAESVDPAPDAVAYHFRAAGDERATVWLTNAGWRAFRAFAYETARARFEEALPQLKGTEQVRALLALARLDPFQKWGMRYAEQAFAAAQRTDDVVLAAVAQFRLGMTLLWQGSLREALLAMDAATTVLDTYPDDALPDLYGIQGLTLPRELRLVYRAQMFACSGQWRQVFTSLGGTPETIFARLDRRDVDAAGVWEDTNAKAAIWMACVVLGRVADAQQALALSHATFLAIQNDGGFLFSLAIEGVSLLLPFTLDDRDARQRYDAAVTTATRRVEAAFGVAPPNLNHCPLLIAAGRWAEARALWASRDEGEIILDAPWILPHIGAMARAQGERDEAWALVCEGLPDDLRTEPGTTYFIALDLHCLAARLTLDDGAHEQARQWLEAHDRWLDWAGPEVRWGRANGQLARAEYHRAVGEPEAALRHAEHAVAEASAPRQPLVLL
ncbi:MAG: AAA family ATPase, partial [Chloroflexota bacterium]|nr:AAA family ATPase [Chloroflexota bacterium]